MGRPRKTEEAVKTERKPRTKKAIEPEVKVEQDPIIEVAAEEVKPDVIETDMEPDVEPIEEADIETEDPKKYKVINITSWLNVREGPGKNYKTVDNLDNGNIVNVYEIKDGWARIDESNWVSMEYLTEV